jgi:hypothetical protein
MKTILLALALCTISIGATAKGGGQASSRSGTGSHHISGYTTKKGTYVAPSHATNPNGTKRDNYSQKGNVNPYTGKEGTKN